MSDSAIILEFNTLSACGNQSASGKKIWHFPHGYLSFIDGSSQSTNNYANAVQVDGFGILPQTAARRNVDNNWWINRRVFEKASDSSINTDLIVTSAHHFYKRNSPKLRAYPFIGFSNDEIKSIVSNFTINGRPINIDVNYLFPKNNKEIRRRRILGELPDTIPTRWFRVRNNSYFDFLSKGMNINNVKMIIERKLNRQAVNINLTNVPDTLMQVLSYRLVNGNNEEFRILFINRNTATRYTEDIHIMPEIFLPSFNKKNNIIPIIDLKSSEMYYDFSGENIQISIHPNPADEKVYITTFLPDRLNLTSEIIGRSNKIEIKIFSVIGTEVFKKEIRVGETIEIQTNQMPSGIYFLKAEHLERQFDSEFIPPIIKSFVIER